MAKYFWKKSLLPYLSSTFDLDEAEQGAQNDFNSYSGVFSENK